MSSVSGSRQPANGFWSSVSRKLRTKKYCAIVVGLIGLIILAVVIIHFTIKSKPKKLEPPDPEVPLPASLSMLRKFYKGAVCSDGVPCSEVGKNILKKNGSAVDAAIATLFCNGVVNCQSMGLGGGFLMTIYDRKAQKAYSLNARERAPFAANENLYRSENASKWGPLAVGVPGELAGYWAAHKRFGRLPWSEVVAPALKVCEMGYSMSRHQYDSLNFRPQSIYADEALREAFVDMNTGRFYPEGKKIYQRRLCKTLKTIAESGGDVLYNGSLAKTFVDDIKEMGGIITLKDMQDYRVHWDDPIKLNLSEKITLYTSPPPGGGALVAFILNILKGFKLNKRSVATIEDTIRTYHRMIESFKYAFALRTELGDPRFVNVTEALRKVTSESFGESIRNKIDDRSTSKDPRHYGASVSSKEDHGTAHICVIAPDGDAVSVTSTVNLYMGAGITSKSTGIVLNSGMDDFASKYYKNYFELPLSKANRIEPGKQPLSSMCPTIVIDQNGDVLMVVGAAGGSKIATTVAFVILRHIYFGEDVKKAVDTSRIHNQLFPITVVYEYGVTKDILDGLNQIGHITSRIKQRLSVVCAITKYNETIQANADYRKGGEVQGF